MKRFLLGSSLIRPVRSTDAKAVATILVDTRRTSNAGHLPETYLKNLSYEKVESECLAAIHSPDPREIFLVAEGRRSNLIGFIHGKPTPDAPGTDSIELKELYISSNDQRLGFGEKLVRQFMVTSLSLGIKDIFVWVLSSNVGARYFYEKLGARYSHEAKRVIGGETCDLVIYVWSEEQLKAIVGRHRE